MFGLGEADGHLEVEVWPDNLEAVNVFIAMGTQWRYAGMGSPTGLEYAAVEPVLRLTRVARKRWSDVFESLRVMERAAIEFMRAEAERG